MELKNISFETAVNLLRNGFRVRWYSPDGADSVIFFPNEYSDEEATGEFSWKELFEGQWELLND